MEQDKFERLIENGNIKIVLDTNIILDLARYEVYTTENILTIFNNCINLLWLPNQVLKEYKKNYNVIPQEINKKEKTEKKYFEGIISDLEKKVKEYRNKVKNNEYCINKIKVDEIKTQFDVFISTMKNHNAEILDMYKKEDSTKRIEDIKIFVNDLKEREQFGNKITIENKLKIIDEGELRYKYKIPPGFKDFEKNEIDKFGDLFIWNEILKIPSSNENLNIIFLTNDVKEDWWELDKNNKPLKMREELLDEFKDKHSKSNIEFLTLKKFQKLGAEYYGNYEYNVYVDLNKDDDVYIKNVDNKIIDYLQDKIFSLDLTYFNSDNIGSEGIEEFDDCYCEFSEIIEVCQQYANDSEVCFDYELKYNVNASFISYEYYGKDSDTKEIIKSDGLHHEFKGEVIVNLERIISKENIGSMNKDDNYSDINIVETNIVETKDKDYRYYYNEIDENEEYIYPGYE